ncbi:glycine betaine reductase ATRR-like isoform X1 [Haliotis rufescens]|uniref:glycine betaine reductase ATRR-like isoform X1 n=2 Tax=Haliotis rufescens TaxID=6454 RepID=UPI00201F79B1|nr:glycine betaine reductase ATRR-like isoform X1 [Haliotis rufescens]
MEYEKEGPLHEMFSRQARATPDNMALISLDGREVTFRELDQWTDILARKLVICGVAPDSCVGIYMDKSVEFVTAYIAILKAGGAYLPIDTSYPTPLLESILKDAQPVAVLTSKDLSKNVTDSHKVIELADGWQDRLQQQIDQQKGDQMPHGVTLDNLAYIVYSSGTTGRPKGIMCPHRGAVFSYHWRHISYPYGEGEREGSNIFFVWEMLRPILKGVPMCIVPNSVIYDPHLLCQSISNNVITRILFTPSLLETILNTADIDFKQSLKTLRQIWFCGEVVTTALLRRCVKTLPWIRFVNLYSISECHDVACEDLTAYYTNNKESMMSRKFCPVGKLLPGVHVAILNEDQQVQPVGMPGEIFVSGPTLARGYLKRPDIQEMRFIQRPDTVPASYGDVLYRTGDWGYVLSDSSLEICGRCDSMVKIRGYSIEVQAVESALMSLPMVNACVVLVIGEEGEDKFLVSYLVPEGQTNKKEVRAALKRRLPFYMIPSYFVILKSIPIVKATGKLDKKSLPPFEKQDSEEGEVEGRPTTETEVKVADIWSKVLQMRDIDIQESFFDMGGHSLLAAQLLNVIQEKFGFRIAVQDLFSYPTVYSLSRMLDSKLNNTVTKCCAQRPKLDLQTEVEKHDQGVLNLDIQLRAFWRTFHHRHHFHKGRVLLTGATGFLGVFILRELLLSTKLLIYCLVRELPQVEALDRIKETLRKYGILGKSESEATEEQKQVEAMLVRRVTVIKGNVALINLGMSEDDYTYLCTDIDFIIHTAAIVNLAYPYSALHGPNVLGTANIILFACTGKVKPIHYISTDAVFPNGLAGCSEEDDASSYHDDLEDGYSQSKWVAEQLVKKAGKRGLPVTIYRLGNLSGDRLTGQWNPQDFTLLVLQACTKLGLAPEVNWNMEMTPVDFASKVIVKITQNPSSVMGKTFHVINTQPIKARWVFERMQGNGFSLKFVPFSEWRDAVLGQSNGHSNQTGLLSQLLDTYITDASFFEKLSSYTNDSLLSMLSQLGLSYAYTDSVLLNHYFTNLLNNKLIVKRRQRLTLTGSGALDGKVAIVTGASSGIGSAIALALAHEGAKVAMAARREDKLREVEKSMAEFGGVAISVKTDVTKRSEVAELVKHTEMTLGPVDILVNNAGIMYYTLMTNLHFDEWDKQVDLNCKGVTNCIGSVLDGMVKRKKGHIINISSDAGRKGFPGLAVYSGTKFFVEGMSQALRHEVKGLGVKVTCIQPGDVKTELQGHTTDAEAKSQFDMSESGKVLEAEDVARAVVFAASQPEYVGINEILVECREGCI